MSIYDDERISDREILQLQKENDILKEDNEELKIEIEELNKKKSIKWSRDFAWPLIEKLKEENKKLKEKIICLEPKTEEVNAFCPNCDWEGKCLVGKSKAKELEDLKECAEIGENDFCGCNYESEDEQDNK